MLTHLVRHETARKLTTRVVCGLFTALLVVGNVCAEDDIVDIDPFSDSSVFGLLRRLLDFLGELIV
jgi:hypothetical protein